MQKTAAVRSTGDGTPKLTQHQTVQPADNRVSLTRECTTQGGPLWVNDSLFVILFTTESVQMTAEQVPTPVVLMVFLE